MHLSLMSHNTFSGVWPGRSLEESIHVRLLTYSYMSTATILASKSRFITASPACTIRTFS